MSKLTIMGKVTGILGEAELDMTRFGISEPNVLKPSLEKCADPDAYIEVGLQAEEVPHEAKARGSVIVGGQTPSKDKSNQMSTEEIAEKVLKIKEDIDKYKKELKKLKQDAEQKNTSLNDQINSLGTSLENTKTDLTFSQRTSRSQKDEIQLLTKEVENLNLKLH